MVIYSFEFEECVLAAYNSEPVECTVHGQLELKELAPDAVSRTFKLLPLTAKDIYPTLSLCVVVFALLLTCFQRSSVWQETFPAFLFNEYEK